METEAHLEHCQTFKMERFAKKTVPECRCATRTFQGRGGFVELGHFNKHFVKTTSKTLHTTAQLHFEWKI